MCIENEKKVTQTIQLLIANRARKRNRELGFRYYSEDPKRYKYLGKVENPYCHAFSFECPESQSSVLITIPEI